MKANSNQINFRESVLSKSSSSGGVQTNSNLCYKWWSTTALIVFLALALRESVSVCQITLTTP